MPGNELQAVAQSIWNLLLELDEGSLAELDREVHEAIELGVSAANKKQGSSAKKSELGKFLARVAPKTPKDLALVLGATAALIQSIHGFDSGVSAPPATPPVVIINTDQSP